MKDKEKRVLEALLAYAFLIDFKEEISDKEAEEFFQKPIQLSKEDKKEVDNWEINIEELMKRKK